MKLDQSTNWMTRLSTQLDKLAPRERQLVLIASVLLGFALVWWVAISPALQTYQKSSAAHAALDAQLSQMQALSVEAASLRGKPRLVGAQAQDWLNGSIKPLGKASLTLPTGRAQINFSGAAPEALAAWLSDARTTAGLLPLEAHWKLSATSKTAAWDGVVIFEMAP
jgi:general secretion pathway protein M